MALDESKNDDETFDDRGLTYVIEKSLYENVKPIKVDYVSSAMGAGFNIASSMPAGASCGSGGGGGSCSC
jgi:iron-sulfur cluster assembly protein